MTTFLKGEKELDDHILLKIGYRYMIFTSDGIFLNEISFKDKKDKKLSNNQMKLLKISISNEFFLFEDRI